MANLITSCRILFSIALLFCPALSKRFMVLYLLAGFTDMVDGTVARKTNSVSEFGSKLDTAADVVFAIVCLMKLIPVLNFSKWILIWTGVIAAVKVLNLGYGCMIRKQFVAEHTILNKITGFMIFVLPLTIPFIKFEYCAGVVCVIATFAALQEGYLIWSK